MVAAGQADLTAVDCVTLAHLQRLRRASVEELRILCWTPGSPCLPFVTTHTTDDATVKLLRASLSAMLADTTLRDSRELIFLDGVDLEPDGNFTCVLRLARRATEKGYPTLL